MITILAIWKEQWILQSIVRAMCITHTLNNRVSTLYNYVPLSTLVTCQNHSKLVNLWCTFIRTDHKLIICVLNIFKGTFETSNIIIVSVKHLLKLLYNIKVMPLIIVTPHFSLFFHIANKINLQKFMVVIEQW